MTATIFLVRHAEHDELRQRLCGRMPGVTLGARGRKQAEGLALRLAGEDLAAVYSSPLERALETARAIASAAGLQAQPAAALNELDYGEWSGRIWEDLAYDPAWAAWNADRPRQRPPGGETLQEMRRRVVGWLEEARARHAGERLAAVFHAEPIRAALAWALKAPLDALDRIEISPASVSVLTAGDWGLKVHGVNEVAR